MATQTVDLSAEVVNLKRAVMYDLLGLAVDPETVSMAGGLPAIELVPPDAFCECSYTLLARDGARAMQYSPLCERIAGYMDAVRKRVVCVGDLAGGGRHLGNV